MMATDPYNRIIAAAAKGRGLRLSADDVHALSFDDAIVTRADYLANPPTPAESERQQGDE
jgi:hypothetical protein